MIITQRTDIKDFFKRKLKCEIIAKCQMALSLRLNHFSLLRDVRASTNNIKIFRLSHDTMLLETIFSRQYNKYRYSSGHS